MPFPTHLLTDTCLVSRLVSRSTDAFRTPVYGAWERVRCAHQNAQTKVRDADGNEVIASSVLVTQAAIGREDRVIIPNDDGSAPTAPTITADERALIPLAVRSDRHRRAGYSMSNTFFG